MKYLIYLFLLLVVFVPSLGQAQNLQDAFGNNLTTVAGGAGYNETAAPESVVGSIISVALSLIGVIFLGLMVYGGYLWMTDRGNNSQVEKAKGLISAAIIGLIIVLGAYAITYFVVSSIEAQTLQTAI